MGVTGEIIIITASLIAFTTPIWFVWAGLILWRLRDSARWRERLSRIIFVVAVLLALAIPLAIWLDSLHIRPPDWLNRRGITVEFFYGFAPVGSLSGLVLAIASFFGRPRAIIALVGVCLGVAAWWTLPLLY